MSFKQIEQLEQVYSKENNNFEYYKEDIMPKSH